MNVFYSHYCHQTYCTTLVEPKMHCVLTGVFQLSVVHRENSVCVCVCMCAHILICRFHQILKGPVTPKAFNSHVLRVRPQDYPRIWRCVRRTRHTTWLRFITVKAHTVESAREKKHVEIWRHLCTSFLIVSPSCEGTHQACFLSSSEKCGNFVHCFCPGKPIRNLGPRFLLGAGHVGTLCLASTKMLDS